MTSGPPSGTAPGADDPSGRAGQPLREAARNGLWGGLGAAVAAAVGLALNLVVARALGPGGSGTFFAAVSLAMVLISLGMLGTDTALLWALPRDRALRGGTRQRWLLRQALTPVGAVAVVTAAVVWTLAPTIGRQIAHDDVSQAVALVRIMAVAVAVGPLVQALVQASRGTGDVLPFVWVQQLGIPLTRLAAISALVVASPGASVDELGWLWVAALPLALPVIAVVVRRRTTPAPAPPAAESGELRRSFWGFAVKRGLGAACSLTLTWLDVLLVAALASPQAAGPYAAASRFATSGQLALQAMRLGIGPQVAAAFAREDLTAVRTLYAVTTRWSVALSWPVFLTLALFPDVLLGWFGPGFERGSTQLTILALAMMVSVAAGNVGTLLLMSGHAGQATLNTAVALATNVTVNLLLIPRIGATGAAVAWAAAIAVENGLGLLAVTRRLHVRGHGRRFWAVGTTVAVVVVATALAVRGVMGDTNAALATHVLVAGAILVGVGVVFRDRLDLDAVLGSRLRPRKDQP